MSFRGCWAVAVALTLTGCGTVLFDSGKPEYKVERKLPPLDVPPDLTLPAGEDRYQVPGSTPSGTTTYSAYNAEQRTGRAADRTTKVLPDVEKARVERSASERWLVVSEPPDKVWPVVKEFWQDSGFLIKVEHPDTGVMETDWAENRAKANDGLLKSIFGRAVDFAYSTGERDKFRTRLEPGKDPKTTEVYVSHRGLVEVYTSQAQDSTVWQPRPVDPGLEAEFLRRLMMRFGVEEGRAKQQLAAVKRIERAQIVSAPGGARALELSEPFDRAWRRVGLVLDRVGFTVEDRDRSQGFYYVRYVDLETKKSEGFLDKLMFWRSEADPKAGQYRVYVKDRQQTSEVQVLDKAGKPDTSDVAGRILSLLQQQLK